jgi:hypothetical protein
MLILRPSGSSYCSTNGRTRRGSPRHLRQGRDVDFHVEVARIGHNRAVLHDLEVMPVNDVDVAGDGEKTSPILAASSIGITS